MQNDNRDIEASEFTRLLDEPLPEDSEYRNRIRGRRARKCDRDGYDDQQLETPTAR